MAFNGQYYLKVGDYPIPLEFMAYKTYVLQRNVQDLDSYRDADGLLHRNVLPHIAYKAEFETPIMTNRQYRTFINNIKANLLDATETDVTLTYYDDWSGTYKTGHFYIVGTLEFTHFNKKIYQPMRIAFVEY